MGYNLDMARKIINDEFTRKFAALVKKGVTIRGCCACFNITEASYYSWMSQAEKLLEHPENVNETNKSYLEFFEAIKKAESEFEEDCLSIIEKAAIKDWKAAAWLLERRRKADYALQKVDNDGQDNHIQISFDVPHRQVKSIGVKEDKDNA